MSPWFHCLQQASSAFLTVPSGGVPLMLDAERIMLRQRTLTRIYSLSLSSSWSRKITCCLFVLHTESRHCLLLLLLFSSQLAAYKTRSWPRWKLYVCAFSDIFRRTLNRSYCLWSCFPENLSAMPYEQSRGPIGAIKDFAHHVNEALKMDKSSEHKYKQEKWLTPGTLYFILSAFEH